MKVIKIVRILLEVVGAVTVSLFFLIAFPIVQAKIGSPRGVNDDVLPSVFARVGLVAYLVAKLGALGGWRGHRLPAASATC
jgi:hypothetical protein